MRNINIFREGSIVESFYNSDTFKIDSIHKSIERNSNKFVIHMTSLSSGEKNSKYCTYEEFSKSYFVVINKDVGKEDVISSLSDFKMHVQLSREEQELLVIKKDLTSIELEGNIDRLLEIGDFEALRNYLGE